MKKLLLLLLKIAGGLIVLGLAVFAVLYAIYNEPLPEGKEGPLADALATKMLKAINNETYKNTTYLEWSFAGGAHHYKWDKENGKVEVAWDAYKVHLNLNDTTKSLVSKDGKLVSKKDSEDLISTAWDYFNNESFWLVAPFKVFDQGTSRSIVRLEDGSDGLLVSYTTGGTTPGDAYLWKLLPNGFPQSYQMWVKIIPIGGIEATWDDWKIMENGLALPASHKLGPMTFYMRSVRAFN